MIINSTISALEYHHHRLMELVDEPTAIAELAPRHYDSAGAALFITVVLLWYSVGIICTVGMQIRARAEIVEDCSRRRAKLFIRNLQDQTQTKQILEELVDKKQRDKLWNIYLGKTDNDKEKLLRDEIVRIRNIEKQLAVINRNQMIMNDTFPSPNVNHRIRRTSSDSSSTIENRSRIRRRSSLDQQIIERWKLLADQTKANKQVPWTLRKLMIRRHFRRCRKNSLKEFEQTNHEHIDNEQCHLISSPRQTHNNSRRISMKTSEKSNPFITYFHLPISQNSPLVRFNSNHHIIQINHDESQC